MRIENLTTCPQYGCSSWAHRGQLDFVAPDFSYREHTSHAFECVYCNGKFFLYAAVIVDYGTVRLCLDL